MRDGVARIGIISLLSAADTAGGGAPLGAPPGLGLRRDASAAAVAAAAVRPDGGGAGAERHGVCRAAGGGGGGQPEAAAAGGAAGGVWRVWCVWFCVRAWLRCLPHALCCAVLCSTARLASLRPPCAVSPALSASRTSRAALWPNQTCTPRHQPAARLPAALLLPQIGDWEHAQELMRWLRALGLADFAVFPPVGRALCECAPLALPGRCAPPPPPPGRGAPQQRTAAEPGEGRRSSPACLAAAAPRCAALPLAGVPAAY